MMSDPILEIYEKDMTVYSVWLELTKLGHQVSLKSTGEQMRKLHNEKKIYCPFFTLGDEP